MRIGTPGVTRRLLEQRLHVKRMHLLRKQKRTKSSCPVPFCRERRDGGWVKFRILSDRCLRCDGGRVLKLLAPFGHSPASHVTGIHAGVLASPGLRLNKEHSCSYSILLLRTPFPWLNHVILLICARTPAPRVVLPV